MMEVLRYVTPSGKDVVGEWLSGLADTRARAKIATRFLRLAAGNFGDCKSLREGVSEMRIDWGPGYRVYYAMAGRTCVLLLCGGDKHRQSSDIDRAIEHWKDYRGRRTGKEMKRKASISHDKAIVRELREDPEFASEYLKAALEDVDEPHVLLIALRRSLGRRRQRWASPRLPRPQALSGKVCTVPSRPGAIRVFRRWWRLAQLDWPAS